MVYTSLAVIALSASAAVAPFPRLIHMHSHAAQGDTRISLTLHNKSNFFQDVLIGGHPYEVRADHSLTIKAPAGTKIVADGPNGFHKRGDVLVEISSALNDKSIDLK